MPPFQGLVAFVCVTLVGVSPQPVDTSPLRGEGCPKRRSDIQSYALKGQHIPAEGNALGKDKSQSISTLKGLSMRHHDSEENNTTRLLCKDV